MWRTVVLSALVFFGLAIPAQAAVIRVFPKIAAILNADFTPVDPAAVASLDPRVSAVLKPGADKYVVQIDVLMTIEDLQPGQVGFGNAAFNINWTPNLTINQDIPGWVADYPSDHNPFPGGSVPKWADNGDFGPSGTDMQSIIIGTAPRNFSNGTGANLDPRRTLGIPPYHNGNFPHTDGEYAGSVYMDLPGGMPLGRLEVVTTGGSVYDDDMNLTTAGVIQAGGAVEFVLAPEPATLGLCAVSLASLLIVSRRARRATAPSTTVLSVARTTCL